MKAALLAFALLLAAGLAAAAGQPLVRVQVESKSPVLVGQELRVRVQVLVPNFFTGPPQFPSFDLSGTVVRLLDDRGENSTETIAGQDYAAIAKTYMIVPQQAGEFSLPPARIPFHYAAVPGQPPTAGTVSLPPTRFSARLPAGASAAASAGAGAGETAAPAPVARVTLKQTIDLDAAGLKALKVGDTLTRTVEAFAPNTQPMMIPPPQFDAPQGVRVYAHDPVLTDANNARGDFVGGRRIDRVSYSFDKAGDYVLPSAEVSWLNPATGQQQVSKTAPIEVSVAPAAAAAIAPPPPASAADPADTHAARIDWARWGPWLGALGAALLLGGWALRRAAPRYRAWRETRRHSKAEAEQSYFARVEAACRADDARATYAALAAWSRRVGADSITAVSQSAGYRAALDELQRGLFGVTGAQPLAWQGHRFERTAGAARREWLARRAADERQAPALPALNP
jgi:hypothetical protein